MRLTMIAIDNGLMRVAADGPMTADALRLGAPHPFQTLLGEKWATFRVLVNMEKINYMDSSAIGFVLTCVKEFKKGGGAMVMHSLTPRVRQVFDLLKIGTVVSVASDETAGTTLLAGAKS